MKLPLPAFILIICIKAVSCTNQHRIPYNTDRVEVQTPYIDSALFASSLTFLEQEGFVVDRSDAHRGTIITDYRTITRAGTFPFRMILSVSQHNVQFRGEADVQILGTRARNVEINNGVRALRWQKRAFAQIDDIARRFSRRLPGSTYVYKNGNVTYAGK